MIVKPDYSDRERRYSESALERLWNAVKPPPNVIAYFKGERLKRLKIAGCVLLAALAGWAVHSYIAGIPKRANSELQTGMRYMQMGDYLTAIGHFNRALKIWPNLAEAALERGVAYRYLGENDEAQASLENAIGINPKLSRAYVEQGLIYRQGTNYPRALEAFTKALAIEPTADAYVERGGTYERMGEHQKAIDDYTQAIAVMGSDAPNIYRARSLARRNLGDQAGYESDRDRALHSEFDAPEVKAGVN